MLVLLVCPYLAITFSRYERILVEIVVFERGVGHFRGKFQGKGASPSNEFWRQKTRVPGLSRGVVCVIVFLAV